MLLQVVLQLFITSLQIGAVYILFSLGLTLIFGIMKIVNFAHGHFFAISALVVSIVVPYLIDQGISPVPSYLLASLAGIVVSVALGVVVYKFGLTKFLRDMEGAFILTLGLSMLLDGIMLGVFGGAVRPVPEIIHGVVHVLGVAVLMQRMVLGLCAVLITGGLYWVMSSTKLGKALRAIAADHEAAMLQGIAYRRLALAGFLIAAVLAAAAGALIAPVSVVSPAMGADYLMKGFIAVVIGGLGSVPGAILGALFIALVEAVGGYYYDSSAATISIFILVIIVLLVRPRGLLGNA
jgi:branched-chain amino acid transport system permease protein